MTSNKDSIGRANILRYVQDDQDESLLKQMVRKNIEVDQKELLDLAKQVGYLEEQSMPVVPTALTTTTTKSGRHVCYYTLGKQESGGFEVKTHSAATNYTSQTKLVQKLRHTKHTIKSFFQRE